MKICQIEQINMDTSSSVDELPDEIIELILSKCPIKSVGRFKSVSKSWQSIISQSHFSRIHRIQRSRLLKDQITFFHWEKRRYLDDMYGLHVMRLEEDENFRIKSESLLLGYPASCGELFLPLCSCNGLFLLFTANREYMLWNPFIRKHIIIPTFNPNTHRKAFRKWPAPKTYRYPYPRPNPRLYHDSVTDDYKIMIHYEVRRCYTVYSCKNGSWGEIKDFPDLDWTKCVYGVDGSCLYGLRRDSSEIISFDARDEKVHTFPLPEGVECVYKSTLILEAVSGRLCLYGCNDYKFERLHLWVMEENGGFDRSWRKLISMEKKEPRTEKIRPVYLTNKDDVALQSSWFHKLDNESNRILNRDAHFIYNPNGNCTFKQIDDPFNWEDPEFFFPYTENLDMPYSNTPPSAPDKCSKRRKDPISFEPRKRPEKEPLVFKGQT